MDDYGNKTPEYYQAVINIMVAMRLEDLDVNQLGALYVNLEMNSDPRQLGFYDKIEPLFESGGVTMHEMNRAAVLGYCQRRIVEEWGPLPEPAGKGVNDETAR